MATYRGSGTPGAGDNFPTAQDLQDAVTAAELAETNAEASEAAASTSEANAATSETNAGTSETNAGTSETNAAASESAAATSETNAGTSETNAGTSETNAETAETNAAASAAAAAASAAQLPVLGAGDVGKGLTVNATYDGYDLDLTIAHTDAANTFTAAQTFDTDITMSDDESTFTSGGDLRIQDFAGAGVAYLTTEETDGATSVGLLVRTRNSATNHSAIQVDADCGLLDLESDQIKFDAVRLDYKTLTAQSYSAAGVLYTFAHGLGYTPETIDAYITCPTSQEGYSAGAVLPLGPSQQSALRTDTADGSGSITSFGFSTFADGTNVYVAMSAGGLIVTHRTAWNVVTPNTGSWNLGIRCK